VHLMWVKYHASCFGVLPMTMSNLITPNYPHFKLSVFLHIFGMPESRHFKFGVQIDHAEYKAYA